MLNKSENNIMALSRKEFLISISVEKRLNFSDISYYE